MECIGSESDNVENLIEHTNQENSTKEDSDKKKDLTAGTGDLQKNIDGDKPNDDDGDNTTECEQTKNHDSPAVASESSAVVEVPEMIDVKVIFNKKKHDVQVASNSTILEFKKQLQGLLGVPDSMQKLMYKGMLQDNQTIGNAGIIKGSKIMLVGSTLTDVLAVSSVTKQEVAEMDKAATVKEPLCKQKLHRKVLDKGIPDDAMPGIKNIKEGLPPIPLSGMLNKHAGKIRLTFKLENDQVWLSTKERTEKLPMTSIKNVISEPIEGHEQYHIMGLQLGPTEASRYWIYWVPAQYIDAIKDAILGKWQFY